MKHQSSLTVGVRLQRALHPLLSDVGPNVEVFEFGVAAVEVDDERVLFHDALLLLLLGLTGLVALLHLLDDAEGVLEVGGGNGVIAGGFEVRRAVRTERKRTELERNMTVLHKLMLHPNKYAQNFGVPGQKCL